MTVVRQQAFSNSIRDRQQVRDDRNTGRTGGDESQANVVAHLGRPIRDTTTNPDGRGQSGGNNGQPSNSVVDQLAYQIGNLSPSGINRAVKNLEGVRQANAIPTDSPLATVGQNARAATFHRGTLLRKNYSHAPWNGGRDGANLPTSGKPFQFSTPGFSAGRPFDARSSDIPESWVSQNLGPEMHNARINSDKQYNRQLLAAGRYSFIRV